MPGGTIRALAYVLDGLTEEATKTQWAVMVALCDWVDDEYRCHPKIVNVAKRARVSRSTAKRALHELVEMGELKVQERSRADGSQTSNEYQFTLVSRRTPPGHGEPPPGHLDDPPPGSPKVTHPPVHLGDPPMNRPVEPPIEPTLVDAAASPTPLPFESFWDSYPNKKGKAQARKRWAKMKHSERAGAIAGIAHYVLITDPAFLKHGSTYLSQAVWEDFEMDEHGQPSAQAAASPPRTESSVLRSYERNDCEQCGGSGWAETVSGSVFRCPECSTLDFPFSITRGPDHGPSNLDLPPRADLD